MLEASERPHQVAELADEPENLSLIPQNVPDGESPPLQVVLWPQLVLHNEQPTK